MKKNRNLFIILFFLIIVCLFFYFRNSNSTIRKELKDFAVKDTASITKIFLADKTGKAITLERSPEKGWLVNNTYKPSRDVLKNLMDVIYLVNVKTPVAKAAYNNVIKQLAATSIKCEIYTTDKNKPAKVYYVGHHTENATGTFMMLENSAVPFITEISGFNGYLTPRFTTDILDWRDRSVFTSKIDDIKTVKVEYPLFPDKSFKISNNNGRFALSGNDDINIKSDSTGIENYLALFSFINFETWTNKMSASKKDSILSQQPSAIITLDSKTKGIQSIMIFPMEIGDRSLEQVDAQGKPLKYDADRMYGYLEPQKELVTIQHFIFDRLLRQRQDFLPGKKSTIR